MYACFYGVSYTCILLSSSLRQSVCRVSKNVHPQWQLLAFMYPGNILVSGMRCRIVSIWCTECRLGAGLATKERHASVKCQICQELK